MKKLILFSFIIFLLASCSEKLKVEEIKSLEVDEIDTIKKKLPAEDSLAIFLVERDDYDLLVRKISNYDFVVERKYPKEGYNPDLTFLLGLGFALCFIGIIGIITS